MTPMPLPRPPDADGVPLKTLSLNCCGMPGTGFRRRKPAIAEALSRLAPDLAALQEVFFEREARELAAASALPHLFHARRLGAVAGGLVLLSRLPLSEAEFIPFRTQGSLLRFSALARCNRKGFIFARWDRPKLGIIATHLLSNYQEKFDSGPYAAWQERQIDQLVDFIAGRDPALPLLVAGDFNVHPRTPAYRRFQAAGLVDAMAGCRRPSMVPKKDLDLGWLAPGLPERIDYVWYRLKSPLHAVRCAYTLEKERLSDHLGLLAELDFIEPSRRFR